MLILEFFLQTHTPATRSLSVRFCIATLNFDLLTYINWWVRTCDVKVDVHITTYLENLTPEARITHLLPCKLFDVEGLIIVRSFSRFGFIVRNRQTDRHTHAAKRITPATVVGLSINRIFIGK